jgi:hypothetical protein
MLDFSKFRRKSRKSNSPIYVIGDSHCRGFSYNSNFVPLFIGPGKEINFITDSNKELTTSKVQLALSKIKAGRIILVFGEPDTRHYLGKGWHPWENELEIGIGDFRPSVSASVERFSDFFRLIDSGASFQLMVLSVPPSERKDQNEIVRYYNQLLEDFCRVHNVLFIDIHDKLFLANGDIDKSYFGDQIHLNNKSQHLVEDILILHSVISERKYDPNHRWSSTETMKSFGYKKEFGCYTLQ